MSLSAILYTLSHNMVCPPEDLAIEERQEVLALRLFPLLLFNSILYASIVINHLRVRKFIEGIGIYIHSVCQLSNGIVLTLRPQPQIFHAI
jgi:hypothetical protein